MQAWWGVLDAVEPAGKRDQCAIAPLASSAVACPEVGAPLS